MNRPKQLLKGIGRHLNRLADWSDRHYPYARVSHAAITHRWISAVLLILAGGIMWFAMQLFDGALWLLLFVVGDLLLLSGVCLCMLQTLYFCHRAREYMWEHSGLDSTRKGPDA